MNCQIISIDKKQSYSKVQSISLPTDSGQMQILANHAEMFVELVGGELILQFANEIKKIRIDKGICYFKDNICYILL